MKSRSGSIMLQVLMACLFLGPLLLVSQNIIQQYMQVQILQKKRFELENIAFAVHKSVATYLTTNKIIEFIAEFALPKIDKQQYKVVLDIVQVDKDTHKSIITVTQGATHTSYILESTLKKDANDKISIVSLDKKLIS